MTLSPVDHALAITARTEPLRIRVAAIGEQLRGWPPWRRQGAGGEALVRERQALLARIDVMSRPGRPTPKPRPKSVSDEKAVQALIAESLAEAKADAARAQPIEP